MHLRSISREIALITLSQIDDKSSEELCDLSIDQTLNTSITSLNEYWQELIDESKEFLESANQLLLDSELGDSSISSQKKAREDLKKCSDKIEILLNSISDCSDFSRLLSLSDLTSIKNDALIRINHVVKDLLNIDTQIDSVMDGWRLKRLPRIDRDILRLAYIDIVDINTPISVACNEAVNLANRYSDEQGRKMINGVLRRLQKSENIF